MTLVAVVPTSPSTAAGLEWLVAPCAGAGEWWAVGVAPGSTRLLDSVAAGDVVKLANLAKVLKTVKVLNISRTGKGGIFT